jgi:di/tricarboxylate transporter
VLEWKDAEKALPWELFIYFGGVITLSDALTKTHAFEWLIRTCLDGMGVKALPMLPLLILLMGFTIFSHAIWSTTTAMAGVMIPIYIGIAQALHFDVVAFVLPMAILMAYALFFPFNTMGNILMFGTKNYTVEEQLKSSLLVGLGSWALWALTAVTWWRVIGLV